MRKRRGEYALLWAAVERGQGAICPCEARALTQVLRDFGYQHREPGFLDPYCVLSRAQLLGPTMPSGTKLLLRCHWRTA